MVAQPCECPGMAHLKKGYDAKFCVFYPLKKHLNSGVGRGGMRKYNRGKEHNLLWSRLGF